MLYQSLVFVTLLSTSHAFILETHSERCYRNAPNVNSCLLQAINNLKPQIRHGDKKFGIPSFDPLLIPKMTVRHSSPLGHIEYQVTNFTLHDMYDYVVTNVSYSELKLSLDIELEKIRCVTEYMLEGEFLNIPLKGAGKSDDLYSPVLVHVVILKDTIWKGTVQYCNILNVQFKLNMNIQKVHLAGLTMQFDDNTDGFLNEHKEELSKFMSKVYEGIFKYVWTQILTNMCGEVPFNDILPTRS